MEQLSIGKRNSMAAIFGAILAIYYVIEATLAFSVVSHLITYYVVKAIGYIIFLVIMGFFAAKIRKQNGGYIEFRQVYSAIIIMALISGTVFFIYNYVYVQYIDKDFTNKLKGSIIALMEQMKVPDESLNATIGKLDKEMEESKHFNLGNNLLAYSLNFVFDSLFGLIVAAIVKKRKNI